MNLQITVGHVVVHSEKLPPDFSPNFLLRCHSMVLAIATGLFVNPNLLERPNRRDPAIDFVTFSRAVFRCFCSTVNEVVRWTPSGGTHGGTVAPSIYPDVELQMLIGHQPAQAATAPKSRCVPLLVRAESHTVPPFSGFGFTTPLRHPSETSNPRPIFIQKRNCRCCLQRIGQQMGDSRGEPDSLIARRSAIFRPNAPYLRQVNSRF
jgi:hypothetical protein